MLLALIGVLLFATLQVVRKKEAATRALQQPGREPASQEPSAETPAVAADELTDGGSDDEPLAPVDLLPDTQEAGQDEQTVASEDAYPETSLSTSTADETPDWDAHAAARITPGETVGETLPEDAEIAPAATDPDTAADEPDPQVWSEPTPTAMTDAAMFDDATAEDAEAPGDDPAPHSTDAAEGDALSGSPVDGEPSSTESDDSDPFLSDPVEPESTGSETAASTETVDSDPFAADPVVAEPFHAGEAAEDPAPASSFSFDDSADDSFAFGADDSASIQNEVPEGTVSPTVSDEEAAAVASEAGIPEEEPFERAGRWWFKRSNELLVYNEQTGEWVPSPTPLPDAEPEPAARFGPDATVTQTITDITASDPEPDPEPEAEPEPVQPTTQLGFWKCPSCGAVNGSTASTCRMCFSARPAV